jgi:transmembrane sensor
MYILVMDKKTKQQELLQKYLDGEATPEEKQQVENWYAGFEQVEDGHTGKRKKRIEQELRDRIYSHPGLSDGQKSLKVFRLKRTAAIAASILLPLIIGIGAWLMRDTPQQHQQSQIKWLSMETKAGERKKIILSDSSEIWLNAASRIHYPEKFEGKERIIKLVEGEAFFNISHHKNFPFRVLAPKGIYTRVLGTSFNISAYTGTEIIDVAVSSGKVAVGKGENELAKLVKGQGLNINILTSVATSHETGDANAWTRNELVFNGHSLKEVAAVLGRAYGITVNISENVNKNLKCRGRFSLSQQPAEIVGVLCTLHGLHYRIIDNTIIIKNKKG